MTAPRFAILRVAKLRTAASVATSAAHILRERPTPNADPARTARNVHEGPDTAADVLARVQAVAAQGKRNPGADPVLALEYLVTASPEAFKRGGSLAADRGRAYLAEALAWIKARHVDGTVVLAEVHNDETSPHLQVLVVPLARVAAHTRKRNVKAPGGGRQTIEQQVEAHTVLSASRYVDGRARLGRMQSEFAAQVGRRFGLERGVERSEAKHTSIRAFYGAAKRAVARAAQGIPLPRLTFGDLAARVFGRKTPRMQEVEAALADQEQALALDALTAPALRSQARALNARQDELDEREKALDAAQRTRAHMARQTARLIKAAYTPAALFEAMGLPQPQGKADVFALLVKAGEAADFAAAVEMVAARCPPEQGALWPSLAVAIDSHDTALPAPSGPAAGPDRTARQPTPPRTPGQP